MTDTYDEQIEAILAGDVERFIKALGPDAEPDEVLEVRRKAATERNLYGLAWGATPQTKTSLFAYLPGCHSCASEIENEWERRDNDLAQHYYDLVHANSDFELASPNFHSIPDRKALNEFARRQRLCRAEKSDA